MTWGGGPVLGIETSCDETSAGIVEDGRIRGHVVASQDVHAAFGGVVPEIAARAHLRQLDRVVEAALDEASLSVDGLAGVGVTTGPGLIGCLLVGVNWAKALAFAQGIPFVGVHHMEAHLFANSLERPDAEPPFVALLVSGGHTLLLWVPEWRRYDLLGQTRDDAAGEAFDKVARRLGLGYPGGPEIQRAAARGRAGRYSLPRPMLTTADGPEDPAWFDFSFSGLKTALSLLVAEIEEAEGEGALASVRCDLAAEFQEAAIEVLVTKTIRATELTGCRRVIIGGGVACNSLLQERLGEKLSPGGELYAPTPRLATDNGAMVARLAEHRLLAGDRDDLDLSADPSLPFPNLEPRRPASGGL